MRILSAVDAISPAWEHTRRLLFARRDWRLLLKIGAVAFFAEVGGCNSGSFNGPMRQSHGLPPAFVAAFMALALVIGIVGFLIFLVFFYLSSRLQFTLFDIVLRSDTTVAPIWRRYGGITWRWMGLKFLFFLAALLCILPLLIPVILRFIHTLGTTGQIADPAGFFVALFGFIASIFLIVILISACYILLRDFGLPSMAMENTSLGLTVGRILRFIRAEPGQVALYLLMHFLMRIAGAFVLYFVLGIAMLIALIPFGGAALVLWAGLHHAGTNGHIAMIAGWVVLGIVLFALLVIASIMLFGYLFTFFQAYALYFLGGRYPMLGAYLDSAMPPIVSPMPPPAYAYPAPPPIHSPAAYVTSEPVAPTPPPADPDSRDS